MKTIILFCVAALALVGCNNGNKNTVSYPAPGTVIDSIGAPIETEEGKLNNAICKVVVTADSSIKDGVYDIHTEYWNNAADGKFVMPKGLEKYTIKLTKTDTPYSYIIGFTIPGDTTYHPYLKVIAGKSSINMKYLKSYTFE